MSIASNALVPTVLNRQTMKPARQLLLVAFGVALITISAKVQVPFWPVPMTLQTLAIMGIFAAYGASLSVATIVAYLGLGLLGAPVFAGAAAGPAYLLGPTAGFLAGFVIAAMIVGYAADRGMARNTFKLFGVMVAADIIIFALGFAWLASLIGAEKAFQFGVQPFVLGDIVKMALAAAAVPALSRLLTR